MPKHQLENSTEFLSHYHLQDECEGPCTIHNLTDHHMRSWPQHWRSDRYLMERICPHGIGHPDPDSPPGTDTVHGCDGCCRA